MEEKSDLYEHVRKIIDLELEMEEPIEIIELKGGQINHVFDVNNKYVIKVENSLDVLNYQADICRQAYQVGVKLPKIVATGYYPYFQKQALPTSDKQRNNYLIMEKLPGVTLSKLYDNTYTQDQKKSMIEQICQQMKKMHSIKYSEFWMNGHQFPGMAGVLENMDPFCSITTKKHLYEHIFKGQNEKYLRIAYELQKFYEDKKWVLGEEGGPVLVHNDLHFCNILATEDGELTGVIDFDFSRKALHDYQLFRILAFFLKPQYYVEEEQEQKWKGRDFSLQVNYLKQFYPELFQSKHLIDKIRIYFIEQIMGDIQNQCFEAVDCWYTAIFESDWLSKFIVGNP